MYEKFFGFKERPFQLVPNPAYLFLSKSHEDVLAHLTYAVSQGDGFVEITGEVGTGKTTLCRVFLGNLEEKAEAAYIFNPMLNAVGLLKTINEEFGIDSVSDNTKDLIDGLNLFLMEKKRQGKQVLLLIDEAQNLNKDVLEQLRLLSNLETDTSKLLQIILVGQPELRDTLDSYELRQLRQRITLSCHLRPLNLSETRDYIRHRIQIAAHKPGLKFTGGAFRSIYRYSKGIPRLINIVCDRTLLTAYGLDQRKITSRVTAAAIQEISTRGSLRRFSVWGRWPLYIALFLLCIALLAVTFHINDNFGIPAHIRHAFSGGGEKKDGPRPASSPHSTDPDETEPLVGAPTGNDFGPAHLPSKLSSLPPSPEQDGAPPTVAVRKAAGEAAPDAESIPPPPAVSALEMPAALPPMVEASPQAHPGPGAESQKSLEKPNDPATAPIREMTDVLNTMDQRESRSSALETALSLWQTDAAVTNPALEEIDDPETFFQLAAAQKGFSLYAVRQNLSLELIRRLNLPVVFELRPSLGGTPVFLPLVRIKENESLVLRNGTEDVAGNWAQLAQHWTGRAYIPWKNLRGLVGVIPVNAPEASVITLKMILREIGYDDIFLNPVFDDPTRAAVRQVQARHGLPVDGYVGTLTKIALYNEMAPSDIPRLEDDSRFNEKETDN